MKENKSQIIEKGSPQWWILVLAMLESGKLTVDAFLKLFNKDK